MRILFAGTPATAVPSLRRIVDDGHDVAGVLTRPPARVGRKRELRASAVHQQADAFGIPVATPSTLWDPEAREWIAERQPEAVAVVAYGLIVPRPLLEVPEHGWVNLHFSLLPAWRGAAPVQYAIAAGDQATGACTFRLEEDLDTGPIFAEVNEWIRERDTAGDLLGRLALSGAELLARTLRDIESGRAEAFPQSGEPSYAPTIAPEDAKINWRETAERIDRVIRAHTPSPGPWTELGGVRVKLGPVDVRADVDDLAPGQIRGIFSGVLVGTGSCAVELGWVSPAGKRPMAAVDWHRGARLAKGQTFDVGTRR